MRFLAVVAALVAVTFAQKQAPGPTEADQAPGPSQVFDPAPAAFAASIVAAPSANEASMNDANAVRQHRVNQKALYYGAGVGMAPYYGVPGTAVRGAHTAYHGAYNGAYNGAHNGAYGHHGAYNGAYRHPGAYNGAYGHPGAYNGAYGYQGAYNGVYGAPYGVYR